MIKTLLDYNARWAEAQTQADPEYFQRLSNLQTPEFLWIGCSDSRVPANVITGLQPGEVFVHRNIANLVHSNDINLLSVLEFAVFSLKVQHIIVCGHYGCGGIAAAVDSNQHRIIDHWLQPIREIAAREADALSVIGDDPHKQLNYLCRASVRAQVKQLAHIPIIRNAWANGQTLALHGWVYGLHDGLLRDLNCTIAQP